MSTDQTTSSSVAEEFSFVPQQTFSTFEPVGFGPFVVRREALLQRIISEANPRQSCHISGCKGAGKTTVLHQLGLRLQESGKEVYLFANASELSRVDVIKFVKGIIRSKRQVYLLVDETQDNTTAALFTLLLKNNMGHNITTIGAGVPKFQTVSTQFAMKITTDELFISTKEMLISENILGHFSTGAATLKQRSEIESLLGRIRDYVDGHIYPLMWLAERLVPIVINGGTADEAGSHMFSSEFRASPEFKSMRDRIVPEIDSQVFRALFTMNPDVASMKELRRYGLCDKSNKLMSQLLFDGYVESLTGQQPFGDRLSRGTSGIKQLLRFALPQMNWQPYLSHGGPIEDALTFELMLILS